MIAAALAVVLAGTASRHVSVTIDEFAYLPNGLAWVNRAQPVRPDGNPPLFKALPALSVLSLEPRFDPEWLRSEKNFWTIGRLFMRANAARYHELYSRARLVPLAFLGLTCIFACAIAVRLYGALGGTLASALLALEPNVLAHGTLVTPDIFFSSAMLLALLVFLWFVEGPTKLRAATLGAALALTCLFKLTGLLLIAVLLLSVIISREYSRRLVATLPAWHDPKFTFIILGTTFVGLHTGYLFRGSLSTFSDVNVGWPPLLALKHYAPWLPTLLPAEFIETLDFQIGERGYPAYLDGVFNQVGFVDYYVRAIFYKTPLALLIGVFLATVLGGRPTRRELPLLIVFAALIAGFSVLRFKNIGVRYILFAFPLLCVWSGRLVTVVRQRSVRGAAAILVSVGIVGGATWAEVTSWPNHLAYFNALAGGPAAGHRHLLDSNIDWGQGLIRLKHFIAERRIDSLDLAYGGRVDPAIYEIQYATLYDAGRISHRWVAVSTNLLFGRSYFVNGSALWPQQDAYAALRARSPATRLDYSLWVFDLELEHTPR
jgi:Dolichyl-phosphate-mannose-protein mannosyltransferase